MYWRVVLCESSWCVQRIEGRGSVLTLLARRTRGAWSNRAAWVRALAGVIALLYCEESFLGEECLGERLFSSIEPLWLYSYFWKWYIVFILLLIWREIGGNFMSRSNGKPITFWHPSENCSTTVCEWLSSLMVKNWFGFGFTTLNWKPLYLQFELFCGLGKGETSCRGRFFFFPHLPLANCFNKERICFSGLIGPSSLCAKNTAKGK